MVEHNYPNQEHSNMPTKVNPPVEPTKPRGKKVQTIQQKGAAALIAKYGPDHFRKLAAKRWKKHPEQRSAKVQAKAKARAAKRK